MKAEKTYLISDASKLVQVESHVLRYWEEELQLPVKRNEMGHRYYTESDIQEFREIKKLKEQGLQLKAIRMVLKEGKIIPLPVGKPTVVTQDDKAERLQYLIRKLIGDVVEECNEKLLQDLSHNMVKELDYQFRLQEEREEQRENRQMLLEEEHYKQLDALIRNHRTKPSRKKAHSFLHLKKK